MVEMSLLQALAPATYVRSEAQKVISVRRPITTTTVFDVYGSDDNYTTPRLEFVTDENLSIQGYVQATNNADLLSGYAEYYLNGVLQGTLGLVLDPVTMVNRFSVDIGSLPEGDHTILIRFPRQRI